MGTRRPHKPKPGASFGDLGLDTHIIWDARKNGVLTPFDVKPSSTAVVWWLCPAGHSFENEVYRIRQGGGCDTCRRENHGKRLSTPKPGRSLHDRRPKAAAIWHPTKNGDVTPKDVYPGARRMAWWLCSCGFEWEATVANVSPKKGKGCPECGRKSMRAAKRRPKPGLSFGDVCPEGAALWDPGANGDLTPFDFRPNSAEKMAWRCEVGHSWESEVFNIHLGRRCPDCYRPDSTVDQELRALVAAAGFSVDEEGRVARTARKRGKGNGNRWRVDVLGHDAAGRGFVVEYDSAWWHGDGARGGRRVQEARDRAKAEDMRAGGLVVVRVREEPLTLLHAHDVVVPRGAKAGVVAAAALARLGELGLSPVAEAA